MQMERFLNKLKSEEPTHQRRGCHQVEHLNAGVRQGQRRGSHHNSQVRCAISEPQTSEQVEKRGIVHLAQSEVVQSRQRPFEIGLL